MSDVVRRHGTDRPADFQPDREAWMDGAACREYPWEMFFPPKGGSTKEAARACAGCDVRDPCLDFALRINEADGIYGGLSPRQRRGLKRRRKAA